VFEVCRFKNEKSNIFLKFNPLLSRRGHYPLSIVHYQLLKDVPQMREIEETV